MVSSGMSSGTSFRPDGGFSQDILESDEGYKGEHLIGLQPWK